MRQDSKRDKIHSGLGVLDNIIFIDPARNLEQAAAFGHLHRFLNVFDGHIVQERNVCTCADGLFQLPKSSHLYLNPLKVTLAIPACLNGCLDPSGNRNVILFNQDSVIESLPVVVPTSHPHRVFLNTPPQRSRFFECLGV